METGKSELKSIPKDISVCFHCGSEVPAKPIQFDHHAFCCEGCTTVYSILKDNRLCAYYEVSNHPGINQSKPLFPEKFAYLDHADIQQSLLKFRSSEHSVVDLFIPQMHCSSCIWLLEQLHKMNSGILKSQVNFLEKNLQIHFDEKSLSLRSLVELLSRLGYEPVLHAGLADQRKQKNSNKNLFYRIGIAGFCFGNIMLLSFPDYLSISGDSLEGLKPVFQGLIILLSIPTFLIGGWPYLKGAWISLSQKKIQVDVPLALGMVVLFFRSLYDILANGDPGFMDTLAGLVFFLLAGKWFQQVSFDRLSFERDYRSYFPMAVNVVREGIESVKTLNQLNPGEVIVLRNGDLLPADALLVKGTAFMDYSFVTGESIPEEKHVGELLYAGGKHEGSPVEVQVLKKVEESYLTRLWNNEVFNKSKEKKFSTFSTKVSVYFTWAILIIALAGLGFWLGNDNTGKAINAFTAVLIIACPCALALSSPFTLGTALRYFAANKFYLKNAATIESLAACNSLVFDKTGTLTSPGETKLNYSGINLSEENKLQFAALFYASNHPLSKRIYKELNLNNILIPINDFAEIPGAGISGMVGENVLKAGKLSWVSEQNTNENAGHPDAEINATQVWISLNGKVLGSFYLHQEFRTGLASLVNSLKEKYTLFLISGDNAFDKGALGNIFGSVQNLFFKFSPHDKLSFVESLRNKGNKVCMVGDGLNDAGALKSADTGIALTENSVQFSPSSDAILESSALAKLPDFLKFSNNAMTVIKISFCISLTYNIAGLWFALQGTMSPLFAAILMPVSSVTVIAWTVGATHFMAKRRGLK